MAYGMRFEDGNGAVQIDSDSTNSGLLVIDSGSGSTLTNVNLENEWIFARPTSSLSNIDISMENTTGNTWRFRNYSETASVTNLTVSWIRARWANSYTTPGTGYGIQVYNSDGELAFDSTRYNQDGGLGITEHRPTNRRGGGTPTTALAGLPVSTDATQYAYMNDAIRDFTDTGNYVLRAWRFQQTGNNAGIYWVGRAAFTFNIGMGLPPAQTFENYGSPEAFFGEGGSV